MLTACAATGLTSAPTRTPAPNQIDQVVTVLHEASGDKIATLVNIPATKIFITPVLMYEDGIHPNARGHEELA